MKMNIILVFTYYVFITETTLKEICGNVEMAHLAQSAPLWRMPKWRNCMGRLSYHQPSCTTCTFTAPEFLSAEVSNASAIASSGNL